MGSIRTAAKAVIIRDEHILLNRCRDAEGEYFALPGGGQQEGEPLGVTIVRECREEIGAEVTVLGLRFVRDYIVANHDFSYLEEAVHQVEHLFACRVPDDYVPRNGPNPDSAQVGVAWMGAADLAQARVYPARIRDLVDPGRVDSLPVYWGDVN